VTDQPALRRLTEKERDRLMRKLIEYTLASLDGVCTGPEMMRFFQYRGDAYFRDGLGQLLACDAMLMGRTTFEEFAKIWPGSSHPWADRINSITKYVFSSTLREADWANSVIVGGDVATEVSKLKQRDGGDLLIYGHGLLAQTLLKSRLLDVLDLSIHPVIAGSGGLLFHENITAAMQLVTVKTFSKIVKLTYEPQYSSAATRE
jgi:dihydrofolate reductase